MEDIQACRLVGCYPPDDVVTGARNDELGEGPPEGPVVAQEEPFAGCQLVRIPRRQDVGEPGDREELATRPGRRLADDRDALGHVGRARGTEDVPVSEADSPFDRGIGVAADPERWTWSLNRGRPEADSGPGSLDRRCPEGAEPLELSLEAPTPTCHGPPEELEVVAAATQGETQIEPPARDDVHDRRLLGDECLVPGWEEERPRQEADPFGHRPDGGQRGQRIPSLMVRPVVDDEAVKPSRFCALRPAEQLSPSHEVAKVGRQSDTELHDPASPGAPATDDLSTWTGRIAFDV